MICVRQTECPHWPPRHLRWNSLGIQQLPGCSPGQSRNRNPTQWLRSWHAHVATRAGGVDCGQRGADDVERGGVERRRHQPGRRRGVVARERRAVTGVEQLADERQRRRRQSERERRRRAGEERVVDDERDRCATIEAAAANAERCM